MLYRLPAVDLSTAIIGQPVAVDFSVLDGFRAGVGDGWLIFQNESGTGLDMAVAGRSWYQPAGAWQVIRLQPGEEGYVYSARYILPNALVQTLLVWFWGDDEPGPPSAAVLGNSPVGGSSVVPSATQVIQDGQTTGQTLVESTPTGFHQSVLITTDGTETLTPAIPGSGVQDAYRARGGADGAVPSRWSAGLRSDGFGFMQSSDSTTPNRSRLWGSAGGGWNTDVPFAAVNGQATVGSFGVPLIVAQALRVLVNVTTNQTILTFTPTANGLYRVSGYLEPSDPTTTPVVTMRVNYADAENANEISYMAANGPPIQNLATQSLGANPPTIQMLVASFFAITGTNIICQYLNSVAPVNDRVTFLIERLA